MSTESILAGTFGRVLIAAFAAVVAVSGSAMADTTLPVTVESTTCINVTEVINPLSCAVTDADAEISLAPFAGTSADASGGFGVAPSAQAQLNYSFEVVGGTPGTTVPLIIVADLQSSATVNAAAEAILDISTLDGSDLVSMAACTNIGACNGPANFYGNISTVAVVGQINSISMDSEAGIIFGPDGPDSASASADPLIEVDPTFANAGEYSIVLSPGVANAVMPPMAATPEPGMTWLLGVGVLSVGYWRRRRGR